MTYPFDLSLIEIIFISVLLFASAAIQGILGFGFAVISSPILVQIEPMLVPQILSLLALPMTFRIYQREKKTSKLETIQIFISRKNYWWTIGFTTLDKFE